MLKAIIFDMDGVLIDSEPGHKEVEKTLFKNLGIEVPDEEHNQYIGTTSYYMWEKIKSKYNLGQEIEALVSENRSSYLSYLTSCETIEPIYGVKELIKSIHENNIELAVASSSPINVIETIIKLFKLEKYFDVLVTGDDVLKSKPFPDIFLLAAEKLGVKPEDCVVFEDSTHGVIAAKKAGMKCVGYKNLHSGNQDLTPSDLIIDNYDDIKVEDLIKL
jgi:beta-phosphoglucomutase family hydrolase